MIFFVNLNKNIKVDFPLNFFYFHISKRKYKSFQFSKLFKLCFSLIRFVVVVFVDERVLDQQPRELQGHVVVAGCVPIVTATN